MIVQVNCTTNDARKPEGITCHRSHWFARHVNLALLLQNERLMDTALTT